MRTLPLAGRVGEGGETKQGLSVVHQPLHIVIARFMRAIQRRDVHRAKGLFRPADARRLDNPHEAGDGGGILASPPPLPALHSSGNVPTPAEAINGRSRAGKA
jgi:hypothetical protein